MITFKTLGQSLMRRQKLKDDLHKGLSKHLKSPSETLEGALEKALDATTPTHAGHPREKRKKKTVIPEWI